MYMYTLHVHVYIRVFTVKVHTESFALRAEDVSLFLEHQLPWRCTVDIHTAALHLVCKIQLTVSILKLIELNSKCLRTLSSG